MKKIIVLTVVVIASQAVAIFAGEPVVSSKQVITPPPRPPPEFFRPNEFDIGAFGTYATGVGSGENAGRLHGWGGGMDFTYWFPWKYAGVRFQGAGLSIGSGNGSQTREVTVVRGFAPVTVTPIPCFQISALRDSGFAAAIRSFQQSNPYDAF